MESLASSQRIRAVRAARQRAAASTMVVHALGRRHGGPRVAVVAGRAVGGAVQRNRAKRRLRAAARQVGLPSADLVIDARPDAVTAPFERLSSDLERLAAVALERRR